MLAHPLIIARKEIQDHFRDGRSLISSVFYVLMGPLVVGMVSFALRGQKGAEVLTSMMTIFTLVAVFVGGMNLAIDSIAGERERRSLLPLLMNPVLRRDVILGKWMAIIVFAIAGLVLNLAGFAIVIPAVRQSVMIAALALVPLAALAAALELLVSTWCRTIKEAHTYLSLIIFAPMGAGMFLVFFPRVSLAWFLLPVTGQQLMIESVTKGAPVSPLIAAALPLITLAVAAAILGAATRFLKRDEIVYGG